MPILVTYCKLCPVAPGLLCRSGIEGDRNPSICGNIGKYGELLIQWSLDPTGIIDLQVQRRVEACRAKMIVIEPENPICGCGEKRLCRKPQQQRVVSTSDCMTCGRDGKEMS